MTTPPDLDANANGASEYTSSSLRNMAPFPDEVDLFTGPHWRMKQLVGLYSEKVSVRGSVCAPNVFFTTPIAATLAPKYDDVRSR